MAEFWGLSWLSYAVGEDQSAYGQASLVQFVVDCWFSSLSHQIYISLYLHRPDVVCLLCAQSYSNTTVYYGIHERSECISVDSGVTNLIHDHRSCVDFTLEIEANVARYVHSSVNKPGVKCNSGL